jgi:hypothetical protein
LIFVCICVHFRFPLVEAVGLSGCFDGCYYA